MMAQPRKTTSQWQWPAAAAVRLQLRVPDRGESMFPASLKIAGFDPELASALDHERVRQLE